MNILSKFGNEVLHGPGNQNIWYAI